MPLTDIASAWEALLAAAEIMKFRFHDCRHDYASRLVAAGVDLNRVRVLLGHSDLKTVLRYVWIRGDGAQHYVALDDAGRYPTGRLSRPKMAGAPVGDGAKIFRITSDTPQARLFS